jgi:flagellar biosynthetic protein FliR
MTPHLGDFTVLQIEMWLLSLIRISTSFWLLPILGSDEIPPRIKAGAALFISLCVFPTLSGQTLALPEHPGDLVLLGLREVFVGLVMGFAGLFCFAGLRIAGEWIDHEAGFTMVQLFDPSMGDNQSALAALHGYVFTLLFLIWGGHHFYIRAIGESFRVIDLGNAKIKSEPMMNIFFEMTRDAFNFGIQAMGPILATLFVTSLGLAIVARIMPQINVWLVGMPIKLALGMFTVFLAMPMVWVVFRAAQERIQGQTWSLLRLMGG